MRGMTSWKVFLAISAGSLLLCSLPAEGMGTAFSYQGRLFDAGVPATGNYDFQFILYDSEVGGSQAGSVLYGDDLAVSDGLFNIYLDFGAGIFDGADLWLEVSVRDGAATGSYTPLSPRQQIMPSPYSLHSGSVSWTDITGIPPGFDDDVDDTVPAGAVMFFDLPGCPGGWSEMATADGRVIVGISSPKTQGGTVGSAFTNLEDRGHTHQVDPPSSATSSHIHSHTVNPPAATTTLTGNHNHLWAFFYGAPENDWDSYNVAGQSMRMTNWTNGMDAAGSGYFPISKSDDSLEQYWTTKQGEHSHSVDLGPVASGTNSHSHSVNISAVGSNSATTAEVAPYIQLLVCRKD